MIPSNSISCGIALPPGKTDKGMIGLLVSRRWEFSREDGTFR